MMTATHTSGIESHSFLPLRGSGRRVAIDIWSGTRYPLLSEARAGSGLQA